MRGVDPGHGPDTTHGTEAAARGLARPRLVRLGATPP